MHCGRIEFTWVLASASGYESNAETSRIPPWISDSEHNGCQIFPIGLNSWLTHGPAELNFMCQIPIELGLAYSTTGLTLDPLLGFARDLT